MSDVFNSFFDNHRNEIVWQQNGDLQKDMIPGSNPASDRVIADLGVDLSPGEYPHERLGHWISNASREERRTAGLGIDIPEGDVHFIPGKYPIFYDFKNTDIVLDELIGAGVRIEGSLLDFGCSSGRNLATLRRAYREELELIGADPAQLSVEWLNDNVPGVSAVVSRQNPPLPFPDRRFDIVIAKSIWTHFSPAAARAWFAEIHRVMKPGGHFAFSTHGPHDVASRILLNFPSPRYERYTGADKWTRETFLTDLVHTYDRTGYYFQAFKSVGQQSDLKLVENADTSGWGLMWMSPEYVATLLPEGLSIVRRAVGRTGNRHDLYVVRRG